MTADRPDTAKARETARQRVANLLKPKSTFENDLFQNFAEVVKCLECTELAEKKDCEIINRGAFNRIYYCKFWVFLFYLKLTVLNAYFSVFIVYGLHTCNQSADVQESS